jgi:hypothetical protein
MKKANSEDSVKYLFMGIVTADLGMLLIGLGGWTTLNLETRILSYVGGGVLFLSGLVFIWIDAIRMTVERRGRVLTSEGNYLGEFELNGHLFEAYERGINNGASEFRLLSTPPVNPVQEAAFIRYLVNEGLIATMWPNMSRQIEEEASWAFL